MYETLGAKKVNGRYEPVHHRLATHWARLVELLYAAERMLELATDPEITEPNVRPVVTNTPDEGIGCVEAPRGTLTHHYVTDENGILTKVNLIVGTTNNYGPMSMSVKKAAEALIHNGTVISDGLLEPRRDGLPLLRSVHDLRHPLPAGPDAAGGYHPRQRRQCGGSIEPAYELSWHTD